MGAGEGVRLTGFRKGRFAKGSSGRESRRRTPKRLIRGTCGRLLIHVIISGSGFTARFITAGTSLAQARGMLSHLFFRQNAFPGTPKIKETPGDTCSQYEISSVFCFQRFCDKLRNRIYSLNQKSASQTVDYNRPYSLVFNA